MANQIRTSRTYKTFSNAHDALARAARKMGFCEDANISWRDQLRWMIAATPDGRFAPVVMLDGRGDNIAFARLGVTVLG